MTSKVRSALLGSAFTVAAGTAMVAIATPASAQCVVNPGGTPIVGTVTCGTTTTTNSTYGGVGTSVNDRGYVADTTTTPFIGTVSSGAVVDGNGLAFSDTVGGTASLIVTNNGAVSVSAGQPGNVLAPGALVAISNSANQLSYGGTGSVTNNGLSGNGLHLRAQGTGGITALVNGNVTSTATVVGGTTDGVGVLVEQTGAGTINRPVNVTVGSTSTIRADGYGIYAITQDPTTQSEMNIINNGNIYSRTGVPNTLDIGIAASQAGNQVLRVTNTGNIGSATDRLLAAGMLASTSNGNVQVYNSGTIYSTNGVQISNSAGNGSLFQQDSGLIDATGTGVIVNNTGTGGVTFNVLGGTVRGATGGAVISSTTGSQTIAVNGALAGTGAGSAGLTSTSSGAALRAINVGTGGSITGVGSGIQLAGTTTSGINNNGGTIGSTTAGGIAVQNLGTGAVNLNNNTSSTLNGRLVLNAGADTVNNSAIWNTQGISDFGAGVDALTNNSTGVINLTGNTTFSNLESFTQNGTVNFNNYTLTGTGGTFTNAGTLNTTGNAGALGFTAFNNTGTQNLGAGTFTVASGPYTNSGTINATNGASTITGQTSFTNSGTINLQDGAANDTLTINSSFVGTGASTLNIDASDSASDRLVINGAASGSTTVNTALLGPTGALVGGGLLVVDTTSSTANAFTLGSVTGTTSPLVIYTLDQIGADYYLNSTVASEGFVPTQAAILAPSMWYQSADVIIANNQLPDDGTTSGGPWAQLYYGQEKLGENSTYTLGGVNYDVDNHVKARRHGMQFGYDAVFGGAKVGATAGYQVADADFDAGSATASGWNFGVYGGFGTGQGFHGTGLVKWDRYKINPSGVFDSSKGRAFGVDGELGYRLGGPGSINYDLTAGLSHVRSKLNGFDAGTLDYDLDKVTSTRGRLGGRIDFGGQWGWFIDAKAYHEFKGDTGVVLTDGVTDYDIGTRGKATWLKGEVGFGGPAAGAAPSMSLYATMGDVKSVGVRAGFRF